MSNKISRRTFLKCTGASAAALGAAAMLGGCGSSTSDAIEVKVGDKVSNWNNLGVQLTSVFTMSTTPDLPDHEYVAVLITAVNRSGATTFNIGAQNLAEINAAYPVPPQENVDANFHALAAASTDFSASCDGQSVECGANISLYNSNSQTFSDSTNLPPQGTGYLQLMLMVPKGWQQLSVTYMPTFAADKTMTFVMTAPDTRPAQDEISSQNNVTAQNFIILFCQKALTSGPVSPIL